MPNPKRWNPSTPCPEPEEFMGSNEERENELFRYLTVVKFKDISKERFDQICDLWRKSPDRRDFALDPDKSYSNDRKGFFDLHRDTFASMFHQMTNVNWGNEATIYNWIMTALKEAITHSPHRDFEGDKEKGMKPTWIRDRFSIFIHGLGVGDLAMFFAKLGFTQIYANAIGGSETLQFALKRLETQRLYRVAESPVRLRTDPMGRGIYEQPEAYQDVPQQYDFIVSIDQLSQIKHPLYTIMNLGRLLSDKGTLAIIPSLSVGGTIKENQWMIADGPFSTFMEQMGFEGKRIARLLYPIWRAKFPSYKMLRDEEWII